MKKPKAKHGNLLLLRFFQLKTLLIIIILSVAISAVITILVFLSYSFIATTNSEVEKQAEEMLTTEPVSMFIPNILY